MMRRSIQSTACRLGQTLRRKASAGSGLSYPVPSLLQQNSGNSSLSGSSFGLGNRSFSTTTTSPVSTVTEPAPPVKKEERQFTDVYVDLQFETLTEMIEKTCKVHANNRCLGTRNGPVFDWLSYADMYKLVGKTRNILAQLGINRDDKVAIISNNRWEWVMIMYATAGRGGQLVPMYEAQLEKDWKFIVEDSDAKIIFAATELIYNQIKDYPAQKIGKVEKVLCLDAAEDKEYSYKYWLKKVANEEAVPVVNDVKPDDVCTIIYTSGTTGRPKGVELCHRNLCADIEGGKFLIREHAGHNRTLAFLPWAHIYGQTTELHSMISGGCALAIAPSRDQIVECLPIVKPTMILSVPILFNKVYDGVMSNIRAQSPVVRGLFKLAMKIARERNHRREFGKPVGRLLEWEYQLFDKLVFKKIRDRLGGNLLRMGAGGAATSLPVLQFFEDIGIPIMEGYGLTETSPVITAGSVDFSYRRLGCVGVPLQGVDVKIIDPTNCQPLPADTDGEVTCSGPIVMKGYRNNPKANEEVFFTLNGQRYFRTGDMGRMVEGKFLKITGRIKEQFKLENGKFVVPAPLEDVFSRGPMILQCFLYGENKKFTVVLVVPNYVEIEKWAKERHPDLLPLMPKDPKNILDLGKDPEENARFEQLFKNPAFIAKVSREIVRHSKHAKSYERPKLWYPLQAAFTQENQMMTPKVSLRRNNVIKNYQDIITALYEGKLGNKVEYPEKEEKDKEPKK